MLTQNQIDGTEQIGVVPFGRSPQRVNLKLDKYALHRNNLIKRPEVIERINYNLVNAVLAARPLFDDGYEVRGTEYVLTSRSTPKVKPSLFRRALHHFQVIELM